MTRKTESSAVQAQEDHGLTPYICSLAVILLLAVGMSGQVLPRKGVRRAAFSPVGHSSRQVCCKPVHL